jgi:hypothetical protein
MSEQRFVSKIRERQKAEAEDNKKRVRAAKKIDDRLHVALVAVQHNDRPMVDELAGFDVIEVADPEEDVKLERVGRGPLMVTRGKAKALRKRVVSLRDDAVGRMAKRGELGNAEERAIRLRAARYYEGIYYRAEICGTSAIDPRKDIVDGGFFVIADTDVRLAAQAMLRDIDRGLGSEGVAVVRAVLVRKCEIAQFAEEKGLIVTSRAGRERKRLLRRRFLDCLDGIAKDAGFFPRPAQGRVARDTHLAMADVRGNPELHRAIRRAEDSQSNLDMRETALRAEKADVELLKHLPLLKLPESAEESDGVGN